RRRARARGAVGRRGCPRRHRPGAGRRVSGVPIKFLGSLAQALAGMSLYAEGHPARDRGIDAAFEQLGGLQKDTATPLFTFLGDEVVYGKTPIRELKAWDWSMRLAQAGIQRLEFQPGVTREEFEDSLDQVLARLTLATIVTSEA